jgi:hypothetical protein
MRKKSLNRMSSNPSSDDLLDVMNDNEMLERQMKRSLNLQVGSSIQSNSQSDLIKRNPVLKQNTNTSKYRKEPSSYNYFKATK